jgi:hypothetical protein
LGKTFTHISAKWLQVVAFTLVLISSAGACTLPGLVDPGIPTVTPILGNDTSLPDDSQTPVQTLTPAATPTEAPTQTLAPSPTPAPQSLWIDPFLPEGITSGLVAPFPLEITDQPEIADLRLSVGETDVVTRLVYALVAPYPELQEETTIVDLRQAWSGVRQGVFASTHLYLSETSLALFTQWWGEPVGDFVRVRAADLLLDTVWREGYAWALIPFEQLEPRWKVITVDGDNPIWKSFDPQYYQLSVPVSITGVDPGSAAGLAEAFRMVLPPAVNRDPGKLTTVILTGVTALVRSTAAEMETRGVIYPALDVGEMFREADILHISNEIPFSPTCPEPNPNSGSLVFCSSPDYMLLLETIGTDVVELTGDHFGDWGTAAVLYTLDLYDQAGIAYYGGGETVEEAQAPLIIEHNGNRIAFVGCNAKGENYTPLLNGWPGAVDCRFKDVIPLLNQLDVDGNVVIMTFQHYEYYYFDPNYVLENDFRMVADAGADIVSGSQAHQPHGMEFYRGSTLFYGLGNLFFDQLTVSEDTARALFTRNVIYDNRHISSEVFTIYFSDYSRPRFLLDDGRNALLSIVFSVSEWGELVYGK